MPRVLNFYMDDSGTRTPNRKPLLFDPRKYEYFALGGVLINEEDEGAVRTAYQEFCDRWVIDYPLHSVEIRHSSRAFSWLERGTHEYQKFMKDLTLGADKLRDTLYELRFKRKSSPMAQIADLYLWPMAIAGYDEGNRAYELLRLAERLIESRLPQAQCAERGTKYSCFELVRRYGGR